MGLPLLIPRTMTPFYDHWQSSPVDPRRRRGARQVVRLMHERKSYAVPVHPPQRPAPSFWGARWRERISPLWPTRGWNAGLALLHDKLVFDVTLRPRRVTSLVYDRKLHEVEVAVRPLDARERQRLLAACAAGVPSVPALLDGRLDDATLDRLTGPGGVLPAARDLRVRCTCGGRRCSHAAAALAAAALRLDDEPQLLFDLRALAPADLYDAGAAAVLGATAGPAKTRRVLAALRRAMIPGCTPRAASP
jgi:uncharacterized Zn finger protein